MSSNDLHTPTLNGHTAGTSDPGGSSGGGRGAGQGPENPWTQPKFITAAIVVALVVIGAVAVLIFSAGGSDEQNAGTPPAAEQSGGSDSACGLPAGDQTVPVATPQDTQWELVGKVAAPTATETHGPGSTEPLRSCFAHSPTGALYAAVNFVALGAQPANQAEMAEALVAEGPGREAAAERSDGDARESNGGQVSGFSYLNYSSDTATIDLALRVQESGGRSGLAHTPMTLRWEDGDWKVVVAADGNPYRGLQALPNLTGYIPWAGA